MPFAFDSPKDVWSRIANLTRPGGPFAQRNAMLDESLKALTIGRMGIKTNRLEIEDDTGFGYLQAQVAAATIRVALPYELKLPTQPSMSAADKTAVENMENLLAAFTRMAEVNQVARGKHAGIVDWAAFAIVRGAMSVYAFCRDFSKVDPVRSWEPCWEAYDARQVSFETDEFSINLLAVETIMPEKELQGYLAQVGLVSPYSATEGHQATMYRVWYREGRKVFSAILGSGPAHSSGEQVVEIISAREEPMFRSIPVSYIPAGGEAVTVANGTDVTYGQSHYGKPFHKDMIEDARAINFLNQLILTTGWQVTTPPVQEQSQDGTTTSELRPGQSTATTLDRIIKPIPITDPSGQGFLIQDRQNHINLIERKGLPFPLVNDSLPRSALLEGQMREQAERVLQPYLTPFATQARWVAMQHRDQFHWLMENGLTELTAEVYEANRQTRRKERHSRTFTVKDLWWTGQIETLILPPPTEVMVARNSQVALLMKEAGLMSMRRIKEDLLGMQQPELDARESQRERMDAENAPIQELFLLNESWGQLDKMRQLLEAGEDLSEEDKTLLADILAAQGLEQRLERLKGPLGLREFVLLLLAHFQNLIDDRVLRLIPQARAVAQTQSATGGAPPPSAEIAPQFAPVQGSPAGNGFNGGGGLNDQLARVIGAGRGSQPA